MRWAEIVRAGGLTMVPLVACSVLLVAFVLRRMIANYLASSGGGGLADEVREEATRHGWEVALAVCKRTTKPVARVCAAAIANRDLREDDLQAGVSRTILREARQMEWGLASIGTIATIAPFIGLFGTVLGVLRAFWSIGEQGKTGSAVVAAGVAEALITTAAGLAIGIIAVVAYNALTTWHGRFVEDLELAGEDMVRTIAALSRAGGRQGRSVP